MDPADWDGQKVHWKQSLGTAKVNGTITMPNLSLQAGPYVPITPKPGENLTSAPMPVNDWMGEEETEYGDWAISPGYDGNPIGAPGAPPTHVGYDYAITFNPDGSEDVVHIYPELCGQYRGVMSHTDLDGHTEACMPDVKLEDWAPELTYHTWHKITGSCDGWTRSWTTESTQSAIFPRVQGWDVTDGVLHSDVPGSTGYYQHIRQFPYFDKDI
ncbi:hypothetical protein [Nocardia nepalensis]|uniref:hypothetical protein n=1 Tax=Nocardia nepalensis TaxID=3375448 RepID=UPI003B672DBA